MNSMILMDSMVLMDLMKYHSYENYFITFTIPNLENINGST